MARLRFLGLLLLLTAPVLRADSLAAAQLARTLLGPDVWSRVLRVENRPTDARRPGQFHVLVFALEDRLWLYDGDEGTQSLSLYAGRLEQDKANLEPLLLVVLPSLIRYVEVTPEAPASASLVASDATLPYGCFIRCFVRWRALQSGPFPPAVASVLAFYFGSETSPRGHSVLLYRENGRRFIYDPDNCEAARPLPPGPETSPLQLAREVCIRAKPYKALLLDLHGPVPASTKAIASSTATGSSGHSTRTALF